MKDTTTATLAKRGEKLDYVMASRDVSSIPSNIFGLLFKHTNLLRVTILTERPA